MDNMNNFSEQNNIQTQSQTPEVVPQAPQSKPPKKPKNHVTLKVMAMIAAVAIVGGGAGFGGAYIAGRQLNSVAVTDTASSGSTDGNTTVSGADSSTSSTPTLDELQSGLSVSHNVNSDVEYNTDGTYMYTRDLVNAVKDSVVFVSVYVNYNGEKQLYGYASGIIISKDGYIVTNNHVVANTDSYTVKVNSTNTETGEVDSKVYDAKLIGKDEDTDLAVLKIDADNLPAAVLGDSDQLHLGDDVIAIGNPRGLETSVSKGVVSGLNRQISDTKRGLSSIQTDTAINSGNSGGALFNMYGEVVGVVNEKLVNEYAENLGFAITINEAKTVINDLIGNGYVTGRAVLGITYTPISEVVAMYRGLTPGMQVTEINQDMAVAKSGLIVGDTIVKIDGKSVLENDVSAILAEKSPGDVVTVTVVRNNGLGKQVNVDLDVELSEYKGDNN